MAKTSADSRSSSSVMIVGGRSFSSRLHQCRTAEIAANEVACKCCNTTSTFTSENCSWKSSRAAEPYSTIDTRFSPHACCNRVTSSCSLLSGFFIVRHSRRGSPTAASAATAAHPPAKPTETPKSAASARVASGATAKPAAPTTSTAPQGAAQQKPGKSGPSARSRTATAASRRARNSADNDENYHDDQQRDPPRRFPCRRTWPTGRHSIQLHTLVRCYQLGHAGCSEEHRSAVVFPAHVGHHLAPDVSSASVVDDRLQPVANLDPVLTLLGRHQKQNATVLFLRSDTELLVEIGCVVFLAAAVEGIYGHNRNLGAGLLLDLGAQRLQLGLGRGIDDLCEIGDVALRTNIRDLLCPCEGTPS